MLDADKDGVLSFEEFAHGLLNFLFCSGPDSPYSPMFGPLPPEVGTPAPEVGTPAPAPRRRYPCLQRWVPLPPDVGTPASRGA